MLLNNTVRSIWRIGSWKARLQVKQNHFFTIDPVISSACLTLIVPGIYQEINIAMQTLFGASHTDDIQLFIHPPTI